MSIRSADILMNYYDLLEKSLLYLYQIWHAVLISIGSRQIKVSNIFTAVILTYLIAKHYHKLAPYIVNRFTSVSSPEDKTLIKKTVSIALGLLLTIIILQIANIPLESFAFIGGALALGVGLGVQNLINNLLSSFIIMIEKPLAIDDIISIDGQTGKVTDIKSRCIELSISSNAIAYIPSSSVLQNKLINWTKNNKLLSTSICLKVPKTYSMPYDNSKIINIIESTFTDNLAKKAKKHKILLNSITNVYYVYLINYQSDIEGSDLLRHEISINIAQKLGSEIIIDKV